MSDTTEPVAPTGPLRLDRKKKLGKGLGALLGETRREEPLVIQRDEQGGAARPGAMAKSGLASLPVLQNRSGEDCVFVAVSAGAREGDSGEYPDIDMVFDAEGYARKDGSRYEAWRVP
ncbi:hypothetical protein J4558_17770 [Leptolyngbya sp. 15MV]|nr:hypothetical protein J4558_17770 [Leptolyngbya sp. 15MV]